ncbi:hypothetical protein [Spiroplasma platyhelix]|uniref:Uncharacterized protein n=1 Tax=Spiroplasma platyhelix PALS-1 TaxID=1276218 RepID=A0A846TPF2_9MOLU|nr:hypothetical protein [Spiroplasma platyhelix]MBE4703787.1 hypothetical protein [Spiroplasma platyhelix PALS-1]NKE38160.1 hypothetical protein [Spiroplasma platyhelix PALS-1]UJB29045.1 hypothetical protein SPLAT_v1c02810 [Spiroplasma platyhelix PALS-1]
MNRILKDCMNTCCCKKEQNICDVIDGLGKVVEEIECNKKSAKESEKIKKDIREETTELITEAKEELLTLINKVDSEKWVIGEYKWMPVGSKMPEGWIKIDLGQGQTLVQGIEAGKTEGIVKSHSHFFPYEFGVWATHKVIYGKGTATGADDVLFPYVNDIKDAAVLFNTAGYGGNLSEDQKENLAAGTYAELWQYKGTGYKKEMLKKCLAKSISDCLDKKE